MKKALTGIVFWSGFAFIGILAIPVSIFAGLIYLIFSATGFLMEKTK